VNHLCCFAAAAAETMKLQEYLFRAFLQLASRCDVSIISCSARKNSSKIELCNNEAAATAASCKSMLLPQSIRDSN